MTDPHRTALRRLAPPLATATLGTLLLECISVAEASPPTSLNLQQGTALAGDVSSLTLADGNAFVVQAAGGNAKPGGKSKMVTDWSVSALVPDSIISLRVTLIGSSSIRTKQTLYLWRWRTGKWKPILNSHPNSIQTTFVRTVDSVRIGPR